MKQEFYSGFQYWWMGSDFMPLQRKGSVDLGRFYVHLHCDPHVIFRS